MSVPFPALCISVHLSHSISAGLSRAASLLSFKVTSTTTHSLADHPHRPVPPPLFVALSRMEQRDSFLLLLHLLGFLGRKTLSIHRISADLLWQRGERLGEMSTARNCRLKILQLELSVAPPRAAAPRLLCWRHPFLNYDTPKRSRPLDGSTIEMCEPQ